MNQELIQLRLRVAELERIVNSLTQPKSKPVLITSIGIIDIRISGANLQYTKDGTNWTTWHTAGTACP